MWEGDKYVYTTGELKAIATNYQEVTMSVYYTKQMFDGDRSSASHNTVLDYKVDFDKALDAIGKGYWDGNIEDRQFKDFRYFGRLQRVVVADMYGMEDSELEGLGFYRIPNLKSIAYGRMARILNDGK